MHHFVQTADCGVGSAQLFECQIGPGAQDIAEVAKQVARVFVSDKSDEEGTCVLEVALNRSEFLRYLPGKFFAQLSPADELWIRVDINCQSRTDVRVVLEKAR